MAHWFGSYAPDGGDDCEEDETDYWRVSEKIKDYAGIDHVAGIEALVLANGSDPTCFLSGKSGRKLFVQEMSSPEGDADVIDLSIRLMRSVKWQHSFEWNCGGPGLLFDAATYGPAVDEKDALTIDTSAGRYKVSCSYHKADSDAPIDVALTFLDPL